MTTLRDKNSVSNTFKVYLLYMNRFFSTNKFFSSKIITSTWYKILKNTLHLYKFIWQIEATKDWSTNICIE